MWPLCRMYAFQHTCGTVWWPSLCHCFAVRLRPQHSPLAPGLDAHGTPCTHPTTTYRAHHPPRQGAPSSIMHCLPLPPSPPIPPHHPDLHHQPGQGHVPQPPPPSQGRPPRLGRRLPQLPPAPARGLRLLLARVQGAPALPTTAPAANHLHRHRQQRPACVPRCTYSHRLRTCLRQALQLCAPAPSCAAAWQMLLLPCPPAAPCCLRLEPNACRAVPVVCCPAAG